MFFWNFFLTSTGKNFRKNMNMNDPKIINIEYEKELDRTPYESIWQLDHIPNENNWSIDSCSLYIPQEFVVLYDTFLDKTGGRFIRDRRNNELILEEEKYLKSYYLKGKYQDYQVFSAQHNHKDVLGFKITSKILGRDYYLGISNKTFDIVVHELLDMLKGQMRFLPEWMKYSYFLDIEYKRDFFLDPASHRESLKNLLTAASCSVKPHYTKQQNKYSKEGQMLLTGISNINDSNSKSRSSTSRKNSNWHVYIKNFQMPFKHKIKKNTNIDSAIRNYNGHYRMLKECGRPMDLTLRFEVNAGNSELMKNLGIDKSVMNILSMNSEAIENKIILPLIRGKFSNLIIEEEKKEKFSSEFMWINQLLIEKISKGSLLEAEYFLKDLTNRISNLTDRRKKSMKQSIKKHINYLRATIEKYQVDVKDMFDVFGEKLGSQMLISNIPTQQEINVLNKKLYGA